MAHAQKPDFVFQRNGRVHLNRQGRQFSRLLAAEVCASAVVMVVTLDTPRSQVVWRVLATHSIRQFPLHFPSRASTCAITFQLESTSDTLVINWQKLPSVFSAQSSIFLTPNDSDIHEPADPGCLLHNESTPRTLSTVHIITYFYWRLVKQKY